MDGEGEGEEEEVGAPGMIDVSLGLWGGPSPRSVINGVFLGAAPSWPEDRPSGKAIIPLELEAEDDEADEADGVRERFESLLSSDGGRL